MLIGQSRGGTLARALAVRDPENVSGLAMLGSPVCDGLAVSPSVLRTVRFLARLGDMGLPGRLLDAAARTATAAPRSGTISTAALPPGVEAVAVHSRSDGDRRLARVP